MPWASWRWGLFSSSRWWVPTWVIMFCHPGTVAAVRSQMYTGFKSLKCGRPWRITWNKFRYHIMDLVWKSTSKKRSIGKTGMKWKWHTFAKASALSHETAGDCQRLNDLCPHRFRILGRKSRKWQWRMVEDVPLPFWTTPWPQNICPEWRKVDAVISR